MSVFVDSFADMSVSNIIKTEESSSKKFASTSGIKKRESFKGRRSSTGTSSNTPTRRQSGGARRSFQGYSRQDTVANNGKRTVRVKISNLAASVVSTDLQGLFGEFHPSSAVVHFNEAGAPLGTGEVALSKTNADRLIQKMTGVSIDGKVLKFALIDSNNLAARISFPTKKIQVQKKRGSPGFKPKDNAPLKKNSGCGKAGGKRRQQKPKKAIKELDAELNAFMSRLKIVS